MCSLMALNPIFSNPLNIYLWSVLQLMKFQTSHIIGYRSGSVLKMRSLQDKFGKV